MTKAWVKLPYVRASATARVDPDPDVALLARLSTPGSLVLLLVNGGD